MVRQTCPVTAFGMGLTFPTYNRKFKFKLHTYHHYHYKHNHSVKFQYSEMQM